MRMTIERIFQTGHFKSGLNALHALTIAALLAAGGLALTPHAAQAFICESTVGGGGGALDGGSAGNVACGTNANASGTNSTAIGISADASGVGGDNTALGRNADASGDSSTNTALGDQAFADGDISNNTATGAFAFARGDASNNTATGISSDASGDNSSNTATGDNADASGNSSNNIATGRDADASGAISSNIAIGFNSNATSAVNATANVAIGSQSVATGGFALAATAVGFNANASFDNSAAFGNGATATRVNQQVFGTASNTYTTPGITSAASTAAQVGAVEVVTTDSQGNLASTSIAALQAGTNAQIDRNARNIDENREGVAMAMAVAGAVPYLTERETFALSGSLGTFDGENAMAFGGRLRLNNKWSVAGGLGMDMDGNNYGGTVSARIGW